MAPDTVAAIIGRDSRSRRRAFAGGDVEYDYRQLCTTAHKTGNFLSHFGVRPDRDVVIMTDDGSDAAPVVSFLGAALLGATVRFDLDAVGEAAAVVAPAPVIADGGIGASAGTTVVAYGGSVSDPSVEPFGRGIWSENPACPVPPSVSGSTTILDSRDRDDPIDQRTLVSTADRIRKAWSIDGSDAVVVRSPFAHPGTVAAGVIAPIMAGAAIVRPDRSGPGTGEDAAGTIAIASADAPEGRRIDPDGIRI